MCLTEGTLFLWKNLFYTIKTGHCVNLSSRRSKSSLSLKIEFVHCAYVTDEVQPRCKQSDYVSATIQLASLFKPSKVLIAVVN